MGDNKQLLENLKNREFIPDKDTYFNNLLSELVGISDNKNVDKNHEELAVLLVSEIIKLLKKGEPDSNPNVESPTGEPLSEEKPPELPSGTEEKPPELPSGTEEKPPELPSGTEEKPPELPTGTEEKPPELPTGTEEKPPELPTGPEEKPPASTVDTNIPTNGEPDKPTITPPLPEKQIPNGIPFPKTEIIEEQKVDGNTTQHTINYYHLTSNNPHQIISTIDNLHK